jgi:putative DNA primase/helicase
MTRIEDEIARRGIALRGRGPERCGPCPVCGAGTDRFSINTKKQLWYCRVCATGGDVIALVQHIDGVGFREASRILGGEVAVTSARPNPPSKPSPAAGQDDNSRRALTLWWAAKPIAGTLAETYLRSRALEYADPDGEMLRFHPWCPFGGQVHPCLIALFRTIGGGNRPVAIHRTALHPDGRKIDRMTLGPIGGAAIKLTADEDVTGGLHIGEGIETTIGAMSFGFTPAWALGNAGAIRAFPVLGGIDCLTILVDHDEPDRNGRQAGHEAARECCDRWMAAGREVRSVVPRRLGADMADLLESVA